MSTAFCFQAGLPHLTVETNRAGQLSGPCDLCEGALRVTDWWFSGRWLLKVNHNQLGLNMLIMCFMSWPSFSYNIFLFSLVRITSLLLLIIWQVMRCSAAWTHSSDHQAIVLSLTTLDSTIQSVQQAANGQVGREPGPLQSGLCPCGIHCRDHHVFILGFLVC